MQTLCGHPATGISHNYTLCNFRLLKCRGRKRRASLHRLKTFSHANISTVTYVN